MAFVGKEHHLSGFHGTLSLTKNPAAIYFGNPLTGLMQHIETQIFQSQNLAMLTSFQANVTYRHAFLC